MRLWSAKAPCEFNLKDCTCVEDIALFKEKNHAVILALA